MAGKAIRNRFSPLHRSVLIVDDHEASRTRFRELLESYGCAVFELDGGCATVALARAAPPDVAVVDLALARMDSFAFLAALRCNLPNVQLLATARFLPGTLLPAALRMGANDTFDKVLGDKHFLLKVHRLLAGQNRSGFRTSALHSREVTNLNTCPAQDVRTGCS